MSAVEDELMKHLNSCYVFEDTVGLTSEFDAFTFPCVEHKDYILTHGITFYKNTRMC